ncbi:metalloprotease [Streptomyces oceani]|uniref:Peptidase M50 n=1 Tax=Streptomyces oceani TaxID=1075402 RepID=A0A1E7KJK8_9ACTN|nr:M50 family metallopeptidase [Streptomyces oceani]OEV04091.1 peptidase M50 [Streptomyces oceani]
MTAHLADYRPALKPGVVMTGALLHGPRDVHLVKNTEDGRSFEVGTKEYFLLSRMDGTHSLRDLGAAYAQRYGRRLGDGNWQQLLGMLGSRGLLSGAPAGASGSPGSGSPGSVPPGSVPAGSGISAGEPPRLPPDRPANTLLRGSLSLTADAEATVSTLHRRARFLRSPLVLVPLLLLTLVMEATLLLRLADVLRGTRELFLHPVPLTAAAIALWASTALHELAHGVVARHHGGRVTDIGLRWRLPSVLMYCTVENYLYLRRRRHQVSTALAGAATNLLFLLPFWAVWLLAPVDRATEHALAGLLFLGSVQALAMLVPLPPLDGYKIVSQLLGATDLAASSRAYLRLAARRDPARADYPARTRRVYAAYGLGALLVLCAVLAAVGLLVHHLLTLS